MTVCQVVQFATIEKTGGRKKKFPPTCSSLLPPPRARLRPLWPRGGLHTFLFSPVMAVKGQPHRQLMPSAPIVAAPGMALLCRWIERRVSLPGALSFPFPFVCVLYGLYAGPLALELREQLKGLFAIRAAELLAALVDLFSIRHHSRKPHRVCHMLCAP